MFMVFFCIISPILQLFNLQMSLTGLDIAFLILSCVFVAAGGYVINDYFDTKIDSINRPNAVLVTKDINRSTAVTWHIVLSVIGCLLGFLVSIRIGIWKVGFMYPIVVGLLWYYSAVYKKMFFVGNFVVAVLTALIVVLPAVYEIPGLSANTSEVIQYGALDPYLILYQSSVLALFAFMTTLIREIIKDMEDCEGDSSQGASTMAIVLGVKKTKIVVAVLLVLTILGLIFLMLNYLPEVLTYFYISIAVVLPLCFCLVKLLKAKTKNDFHFCSRLMKLIMLAGIFYLFIMRYNFLNFKSEF